ncbi:hypothetical protein Ahy_B01g055970 isoform E [Arachis hypogaea]|uniref:Uncharacterized protein n=1 Tax=Arachis hypogaea TaxID=3818 RepID=A0A445AXL9_ARAHY|nr:hypothetical protein Ahy_B01g055970 isoform E [Arachis hypogaea]
MDEVIREKVLWMIFRAKCLRIDVSSLKKVGLIILVEFLQYKGRIAFSKILKRGVLTIQEQRITRTQGRNDIMQGAYCIF